MTDVGMVSSNGDSDMSLRKRIFKKNQEFEGNLKENGDGGCQPTTEDQKIRIEKEFQQIHRVKISPATEEASTPRGDVVTDDVNTNDVTESEDPESVAEDESDGVGRQESFLSHSWNSLKSLFDTKPVSGRRVGFCRVDPVHARKIYDEMMGNGDSSSDEHSHRRDDSRRCLSDGSAKTINRQFCRLRKRRARAALLRKQKEEMLTIGKKKFEIEKIALVICALMILFGYPLCFYLQFYKK